MGYFRAESFEDPAEFLKEPVGAAAYSVAVTDWPEKMSSAGKSQQIRLDIISDPFVAETYIAKKYKDPILFVQPDPLGGQPVVYPELRLLAMMSEGFDRKPVIIGKPASFFYTMSIWRNNKILREWYLPLQFSCCGYECLIFDLRPLIEAGETGFDELRFNLLQSTGYNSHLYLGDLWVCQDEVEHNLVTRLCEMLHLQIIRPLTTMVDEGKAGDNFAILKSSVDVHQNMAVVIGDPSAADRELHVMKTVPYELNGRLRAEFNGEFSGKQLLKKWPEGTPVSFAVPATFGDLSESEAILPLFYVEFGTPLPVEEWSAMSPACFTNFVRDPLGDTVSVTKGRSMVRVDIVIQAYAPTDEIGAEMTRLLRKVFDNQGHVVICGVGNDYIAQNHRKTTREGSDLRPHFVMELEVYMSEFPHDYEYVNFPSLKSLTSDTDPVLDAAGFISVNTTLP